MTSPLSMLSNLVGMVKNQSSDVSANTKQNGDGGSFGFENMETMGAEFTALLKNKLGNGDASQEVITEGLAQQLASLPTNIANALTKASVEATPKQTVDGELVGDVATDTSDQESATSSTDGNEFDANIKFVSLAGMPKPLNTLNEIHQTQIPEEYASQKETPKTERTISTDVELQPLDIQSDDGFQNVSFDETQGATQGAAHNQGTPQDGFNNAVENIGSTIIQTGTAEQASQGAVQVQAQQAVKKYQSVSQDQGSAYNHASRPRITLTSPTALQGSSSKAPVQDGSTASTSTLPAQAPVLEQNFIPSSETSSPAFTPADIPVSDKLTFPTETQLSQQFDSSKTIQHPVNNSFGQAQAPNANNGVPAVQGDTVPQALDDILSGNPKTELLSDALKETIAEKTSATLERHVATATGVDVSTTKDLKTKSMSSGATFASGNTSMAEALTNAKNDSTGSLSQAIGEHTDMVDGIEFTMNTSEADDSALATSGWNNSNALTSSVDASQLASTQITGIDTTASTNIKDLSPSNVSTSLSMFSSAAEGIGEQVVEGVQYGLQNGQKTLNMKLNPHNMGDVRIMLTSDANSHVTARFITNNNDANEQLQNQVNSLRESLEAQGVTINKISVVMAGNTDNNTQFNADESWQQQANAQQQSDSQHQNENQQAQMHFNANGQHHNASQHQNGSNTNTSTLSTNTDTINGLQDTSSDTSSINHDGDVSILA